MKSCCIEGCTVASKDVVFFEFPTSRVLRKRWLDAINPAAKLAVDALVCCRHFASTDYEDVRGKIRLKSKVVPSVFGDELLTPNPTKDPLGLLDSGESQESTNKEISSIDSHNGNTDNDNGTVNNENVDNDNRTLNNENVDNDNRTVKNVNKSSNNDNGTLNNGNVDNDNRTVNNENVHNDNRTVKNDNENVDNDNRTVNNENVDNDNRTVNNDNENVDKDNRTSNNDNENIDNDNRTVNNVNNDNRTVNNDDKNVDSGDVEDTSPNKDATENCHRDKVANNNGISKSDSKNNDNVEKDDGNVDSKNVIDKCVDNDKNVIDNKIDNENHSVEIDNNSVVNDDKTVDNDKVATKATNKRVKKKWVPMRKIPRRNGRVEMSEDSSSQDSVNSDIPPPPILEDLEEHLPNYQIANMKTERQIAAMTITEEPIENPVEQEVEEILMEPHVPVFIELSVGQDAAGSSEAGNDCLMVLESVQCDVDPTLMLEARAEDEECAEHIDLDDDDDDDDVIAIATDVTPPKLRRLSKSTQDPISLLTSSDEDDVILQEPKIDTLSVSDETDEDDLPLQKLIKRHKKLTKKKKPEKIKNILIGVEDFYCMYCQHLSSTRAAHEKHLKTHKNEQSQATTRVYQICKECGFTTSSKSQLHRHQRKHTSDKRYKCPLCTYRSKYNMSLMYHLKTHEYDPKMYNCGACGLGLDCKKDLLEHQKTCYKLTFTCPVCSFVAVSKKNLRIHKATVHRRQKKA